MAVFFFPTPLQGKESHVWELQGGKTKKHGYSKGSFLTAVVKKQQRVVKINLVANCWEQANAILQEDAAFQGQNQDYGSKKMAFYLPQVLKG